MSEKRLRLPPCFSFLHLDAFGTHATLNTVNTRTISETTFLYPFPPLSVFPRCLLECPPPRPSPPDDAVTSFWCPQIRTVTYLLSRLGFRCATLLSATRSERCSMDRYAVSAPWTTGVRCRGARTFFARIIF